MHGEGGTMWEIVMIGCKYQAQAGQDMGGHNLWWRRQPVAGVHGGETQGASRDSVVLVGTVPCRILHEPHGDDECSVGLSDTRHALDRNGKGEEVGSKRQRLWSREGSEIVGPGLSEVPRSLHRGQVHDKENRADATRSTDVVERRSPSDVYPTR
jgi:hypothetical protein